MLVNLKKEQIMYLEEIPDNILPGQRVQIKYDCNGGFKSCGTTTNPIYSVAKKNADSHEGKHICRSCQMRDKNPMQRKEVKEKVKQTTIQRHGTAMPINSEANISARTKKMFWTQEAIEARNEKTKQTNLQRYGAEHIMKTEGGKKKVKQAFQDKYGTDHPMKLTAQQRKSKKTVMERYGVTNVMHIPEFRAKMLKTTFERHGVEYYNQLPEMKNYLRENCTDWLSESYATGGPNKNIKRPEEWNNKQRETVKNKIISGDWNGGYQSNMRGHYPSIKCKKTMPRFLSSLELTFHYHLDHDPNVEWYDYEFAAIPYKKKDGSKHNYFPDFLVKYKDDPIMKIIETKSFTEINSEDVLLKSEAAIDFCNKNNMTYHLLCNSDIKKLNIDIEEIKKINNISFD